MRTYSCDRCGVEFAKSKPTDPPPNPKDNSVDNGLTTKLPIVKDGKVFFVELDLCPICVVDLTKWQEKPFKKA